MIDWEGILTREGPAVWRSAWRVLGNAADADECFQETFVGAVQYARTHAVLNWRALLLRLATARAIDRLRQRASRRSREGPTFDDHLDHLPGTGPSPQARLESTELTANLRAALAELPAAQAEVFCLFHLEGWTYPEIAERLEITTDLVGVWLHRARLKLRERLREQHEVSP